MVYQAVRIRVSLNLRVRKPYAKGGRPANQSRPLFYVFAGRIGYAGNAGGRFSTIVEPASPIQSTSAACAT